jgi:hypothetical protein
LQEAVKDLVCAGLEDPDADLQAEALAATVALASVTRQPLAEKDLMDVAETAARDETMRERLISSTGSNHSGSGGNHRTPSPYLVSISLIVLITIVYITSFISANV